MAANGYEVSDLEDIELLWEDPNSIMDAMFTPSIDNTVFSTTVKDLELGSMAENLNQHDDEEDKESSLSPTKNSNSGSNPTPCDDEKLPLRHRLWRNSRLRLPKPLHINKTVFEL